MKKHYVSMLYRITALFLTVSLLTGCGNMFPGIPASPDTKIPDGEESGAEAPDDKAPAAEPSRPAPFSHADPEKETGTDPVFPDTAPFIDDTGRDMQRDGDYLYSYYNGRLTRTQKETGETTLLYQTASTHKLNFCLCGNNIYFVERTGYNSPDDRDTSLWRMDKDGKNLSLLQDAVLNAEMIRYSDNYDIDLYDDIIYLIHYTSEYENGNYITKTANLYYRLEKDGTVSEIGEDETLYGALPRRFSPVYDSFFPSFPYAMRHYGYLFVQDAANMLYRMDPVSGEKESLGICTKDLFSFSFSGDLLFLSFYHEQETVLFDLSAKTRIPLEGSFWESVSSVSTFPAKEGFFCFVRQYKEDPSSGENIPEYLICHVLPDGSADPLASGLHLDDYSKICIFDGHLYCFDENETEYHLIRFPVRKDPDMQELGTWPLFPVSSPAVIVSEEYENETAIGTGSSVYFSIKKLFLEEQENADKAINQALADVYTDFETGVEHLIQEEQEYLEADPEFYESFESASSYDFSLYAFCNYMDEDTISFCCSYYQYYDSAIHGYYWSDYYVFDRKTGKRLTCEDFVENSAAFLNIATPYVEKEAGWDFDPEMLLDVSRFSLSEDGYTLYFAPYDIDCYAAGEFHITIPYEAFEKEL